MGMSVAANLFIDSKPGAQHAIEPALIGAGIGLILGILLTQN
jgi:ElaB/YqjD/DUF883 family membrane-anchored ribosome-binding protein